MHEFSLIENIFKTLQEVARENRLQKITKVMLKIGKLRQVVPDFLQFAFTQVSKGTVAEGAALEIEEVPITVKCKECKKKFTVEENVYLCPFCQSGALEILTGKEVVLDNIEGTVEGEK